MRTFPEVLRLERISRIEAHLVLLCCDSVVWKGNHILWLAATQNEGPNIKRDSHHERWVHLLNLEAGKFSRQSLARIGCAEDRSPFDGMHLL